MSEVMKEANTLYDGLSENAEEGLLVKLRCGDVRALPAGVTEMFYLVELVQHMLEAAQFKDIAELKEFAVSASQAADLLRIVSDNEERIRRLVRSLCSLKDEAGRAKFNALLADDFITLLMAEWEVNKRFFTKLVFPKVPLSATVAQSPRQERNSEQETPAPQENDEKI